MSFCPGDIILAKKNQGEFSMWREKSRMTFEPVKEQSLGASRIRLRRIAW